MGKGNKKKQGSSAKNHSSTGPSGGSTKSQNTTTKCPHVQNSCKFGDFKKGLRKCPIGKCENCHRKDQKNAVKLELPLTDAEKLNAESVGDVWVCLFCGHQGCGRNSTEKHALKHYEDRKTSIIHPVAYGIYADYLWCYSCDLEMTPDEVPNFWHQIDWIRGAFATVSNSIKPLLGSADTSTPQRLKPDQMATENETKSSSSGRARKQETKNEAVLPTSKSSGESNSNVKGLSNLGNTCFFNSVMQALAQTPALRFLLETESHQQKYILDLNMAADGIHLPDAFNKVPAKLELQLDGKPGLLTKELTDFLQRYQTTKHGQFSPNQLFSEICRKASRFRGFQQQDSQELLRVLLDGVRSEEIRRVKSAILQSLNIPSGATPDQIDPEVLNIIKRFGRLINQTCVDRIFGGQMISTVNCLECGNVSNTVECFLDLSLPIVDEQTFKKCWKKTETLERSQGRGEDSGPHENGTIDAKEKSPQKLSKHQLQKAQNKARKTAKNAKKLNKAKGGQSKPVEVAEKSVENSVAEDSTCTAAVENGVVVDDEKPEKSPIALQNSGGGVGDLSAFGDDDDDGLCSAFATLGFNDAEFESQPIENFETTLVDAANDEAESSECKSSELEEDTNGDGVEPMNFEVSRMKLEALVAECTQKFHSDCSLGTCLNHFTVVERLTGSSAYACEKCLEMRGGETKDGSKPKTIYTTAEKRVFLYRLPAILCLHLKRFAQVGRGFRKVTTPVEFPLVLDMAPYCCSDVQNVDRSEKKAFYSLYAVVEHSGRINSGHYVCYVKLRNGSNDKDALKFVADSVLKKVPAGDMDLNENLLNSNVENSTANEKISFDKFADENSSQWFYVSDSFVSKTDLSRVLKSSAYLLFYERIL